MTRIFALLVAVLLGAWTHGITVSTGHTNATHTSLAKSNTNYIDGILWNTKWDLSTAVPTLELAYSFPALTTDTGTPCNPPFDFRTDLYTVSATTSNQQTALVRAFNQLPTIANITVRALTETAGTPGIHAQVRTMQSTAASTSSIGEFPGLICPTATPPANYEYAGAISIGTGSVNSLTDPGQWWGTYSAHEIGHTLGLKHPFSTGGSGVTMPANQCWLAYTVMAYISADPVSSCPTGGSPSNPNGDDFPTTYMRNDVAAFQYIYGSAPTDGNTVHSWDATTCAYKKNGVTIFTPVSCKIYMNVVDPGGTDTVDLSNWSTSTTIDLTPGSASSIIDSGKMSTYGPFNFSVSYSADIENFIGSSGNDDVTAHPTASGSYNGSGGTNTLRYPTLTFASFTPTSLGGGVCQGVSGAKTDTWTNINTIVFSGGVSKSLNSSTCALT